VPYLEYPHTLSASIPPHRAYYSRVYTKFQALKLRYSKILYLDATYLPLSSRITELFTYPTPAMSYTPQFRHEVAGVEGGGLIPPLAGRAHVNASLMVLSPDLYEFSQICADLSSSHMRRSHGLRLPPKYSFRYPEQEYLAHRYSGRIHLIPEEYYRSRYSCITDLPIYGLKLLSAQKAWAVSEPQGLDDLIWLKEWDKFARLHSAQLRGIRVSRRARPPSGTRGD
jgi:hypothetical protein